LFAVVLVPAVLEEDQPDPSRPSSPAFWWHFVLWSLFSVRTGRCLMANNEPQQHFLYLENRTTRTGFDEKQQEHEQQGQQETKEGLDDWFDANEWKNEELSNSCFYAGDAGRSSLRLFYCPTPTNSSGSTSYSEKEKIDIIGMDEYEDFRPLLATVEHPPSSLLSTLQCRDSPIPIHLVLSSFYSNMLGEFYVRALFGLWSLLKTATQRNCLVLFLEQRQLYLLLHESVSASILDSHHLFTGAFRAQPLPHFDALLHETNCRCQAVLLRLCETPKHVDRRHPAGGGSSTCQRARSGIAALFSVPQCSEEAVHFLIRHIWKTSPTLHEPVSCPARLCMWAVTKYCPVALVKKKILRNIALMGWLNT